MLFTLLRRRSQQALALLCLTAGATLATAQAQTYRALNLGSQASVPDHRAMNSLGQVAYNEGLFAEYGQLPCPKGFFYDGHSAVEIGSLGGGCTKVAALSDAGHVVGGSNLSAGFYPNRAFLWTRSGGMVDLGTLGGSESAAVDVNAAGQVTGWSRTAGDQVHAFFWSATTGMVDLGTLGGAYATPAAINASGQVAVTSNRSDGLSAAFIWSPDGSRTEIHSGAGVLSALADLNDAGQAVGNWRPAGSAASRAFVWDRSGGLTDLGSFGGSSSAAWRINADGSAIGNFTRSDGVYRAFLWSKSTGMTDLGGLAGSTAYAYPYDINRAGVVVGRSLGSEGWDRGFVWTRSTGMRQLDSLVQNPPANLDLTPVKAVSDNGNLVASLALLLSPTATAPVVGELQVDDPIAAGRSAPFCAAFTDPDATDTHSAEWAWGDGTANSGGTVNESGGNGSVSSQHAYAAAGVYTVTVTVTDSSGQKAATSRQVTVYDASRGFVAGAGWIRSPLGAVKADPKDSGRARFALVSRYVAGESRPPGRTVFHLMGSALGFRGQTQGPVAVDGARAHYSGSGRLNGVAGYQFAVTAIDGDLPAGGGRDRLRLRIWHHDASGATVVDYDNQLNPALAGTLREGSVLQRGRVVIRTRTN